MKTKWLDGQFKYDGTQLRSLYAYLEYGVMGDSVVSWQGPCDIPFDHMVDGEDFLEKSEIRGGDMIHFIIEVFDEKLSFAVALQRLFAEIVGNTVETLAGRQLFTRSGDDLFFQDKKFSISIATASPTSVLIHFAVNVSNEGTPVATCSLNDFHVNPPDFAQIVMRKLSEEFISLKEATTKVRWVR